MDSLTFFGIIVAVVAVAGGQYLEGGDLSMLINAPALLIVLGGTLGAILLQTSLDILRRAVYMFRWIFYPPKLHLEKTMNDLLKWNHAVRKDGVLALDEVFSKTKDPFVKKGLDVLLQGKDSILLRRVLELDLMTREERDLQAANVYESMGHYSPTIGILGAVLGLIQVMQNLDDPATLGAGIAVAFIATVYGVGFANLFFLPFARKLKYWVLEHTRQQELLIEGLVSIAEGENPSLTEMKLRGFLRHVNV